MLKKITTAAAAAVLALSACGTGDDTATAEFYTVNGFDVTTTEAPAVDLDGLSLSEIYERYDGRACEEARDISNAIYCEGGWTGGDPDVRVHQDADAARSDLESRAEAGILEGNIYRTGAVVVRAGSQGTLDRFIERMSD